MEIVIVIRFWGLSTTKVIIFKILILDYISVFAVAEMRIEELEKELQRVHQQMLEQLSDSQLSTSEIRGEVEQTRWQLLHESGTQKTEHLRARQDMVNRIIQMGEKVLIVLRSLMFLLMTVFVEIYIIQK